MQTLSQLKSGELKGSSKIKLACSLKEFPRELFDLEDTLELLDLSGNELSELPGDFGRFKKLKIAFFSDNQFTVFPKVLADCPSLTMIGFKSNQISVFPEDSLPLKTQWLILTNNQIEILPKSLGKNEYLQKVAFAGNKISELPEEMQNCKRLELLRISANRLTSLPNWLLNLPRLSWLAFSGNPCSEKIENEVVLDEIEWNLLEIKEQLGEGASGIISKAILKSKENQEVAIKIFKGEVTSDGLPEDELQTCISAGKHSNLVPLLAKIKNHSEGKDGLVMELISTDYTNLGNPPSFETCTRDVLNPNVYYSVNQVITIIKSVASVGAHLHKRGILHGDLYAHNTMVNQEGNALLGDFGAATFYNVNSENAFLLERLDVRAFGCLIDDLLGQINIEEVEVGKERIEKLQGLREKCMKEEVENRLGFEEIVVFILSLV
jgi:tRNA A-37 threonylcarbamoyl transferase component Bud32